MSSNPSSVNNVVILGSGPAGLTCAIYCGRSGLKPIVYSGPMPGGQLTTTDYIENYPGIASISGPELMMNMISHTEASGAIMKYESITSIKQVDDNIFELKSESGEVILSKAVVIATGSSHKKLSIPGEHELANKGVSWCATCDGPMYKDKTVAVLGGGNTAVTEAIFLSNIVERVYLIHRRDTLRAEKTLQDKLFSIENINCIWNTNVKSINGSKNVESITICDNNNDACSDLKVDGVFIAIGFNPCSSLVSGMVEIDDTGYIKTDKTCTTVDGLFAIGDVVEDSLKQAVYSAGQGALCAYMVEKYLGVR